MAYVREQLVNGDPAASGLQQVASNSFREKGATFYVPLAHDQELTMNWHSHITVDPNICHGKACIKGTRIPVAIILANLAAGASSEALCRTYPVLTGDAVRASLAYATDLATGDAFQFSR